jgi:hypothetical protein
VLSINVKQLVANFSPYPARPPSFIIQMASARGDRKSAILLGNFLIYLPGLSSVVVYYILCKKFKLE